MRNKTHSIQRELRYYENIKEYDEILKEALSEKD